MNNIQRSKMQVDFTLLKITSSKKTFELISKEEVLKSTNTHQNLDDPNKHNINNANRPSRGSVSKTR